MAHSLLQNSQHTTAPAISSRIMEPNAGDANPSFSLGLSRQSGNWRLQLALPKIEHLIYEEPIRAFKDRVIATQSKASPHSGAGRG